MCYIIKCNVRKAGLAEAFGAAKTKKITQSSTEELPVSLECSQIEIQSESDLSPIVSHIPSSNSSSSQRF